MCAAFDRAFASVEELQDAAGGALRLLLLVQKQRLLQERRRIVSNTAVAAAGGLCVTAAAAALLPLAVHILAFTICTQNARRQTSEGIAGHCFSNPLPLLILFLIFCPAVIRLVMVADLLGRQAGMQAG